MKVDHLSFSEAVERLAAQAGITLRYEEGGYNPAHQQRRAHPPGRGPQGRRPVLRRAARTSPEAETGRKFLAERGFDQAAAAHFGVGYSPPGWDHLTRYLRGKGFTDKELILSGLAQEGRRGPIDRFRGRLMWPIRDIAGEVVGFGARKLRDDDNGPKYLNTPETPIYKKSQVLYGIDLAKKDIAKASRAVVVEGYTDVMACHLAGVTTAIATCGTAFGGDHIKILRRLLMDNGSRPRSIFTFDGDAAGQKAALRAFEDDQKFAAETYIAIAPDGMDPCELRLAQGRRGGRATWSNPAPRSSSSRSARSSCATTSTPRRAAPPPWTRPRPIVARIKNSGAQHEVAVQLAGHARHPRHPVRRQARRPSWPAGPATAAAGGPAPTGAAPAAARSTSSAAARRRARRGPALNLRNPAHATERELLKLALQRPELVSPAFDAYGDGRVHRPALRRRAPGHRGGGRRRAGVQDARSTWSGSARPPPTTRCARWSPSWPSRRSRAGRVDEIYAGEQLVTVRRRAVDRRIRDVQGTLGPPGPAAATRPNWPPCRTSCGSSSSTTRRCGQGAARSATGVAGSRPRPPPSRVTGRSRTGLKKSPHAPRGGDVSYSTLGCGA